MSFYLGTHKTGWLEQVDVPLFVSHRRLRERLGGRARLPRALGPWALDSGAFTEVSQYGRFVTSPAEYVEAVHRYADEIGQMAWAAPQDRMCEPFILEMTGLSVREHQEQTVANLLELRDLAPGLPFIPVLQGYTVDDYVACVELYATAGVDLARESVVGLGSVCRREDTAEIEVVVRELAGMDLRLHGFGVKAGGLRRFAHLLGSADSMAWSTQGRRAAGPMLSTCEHRRCANCLAWALVWRERRVRQWRCQMTLA